MAGVFKASKIENYGSFSVLRMFGKKSKAKIGREELKTSRMNFEACKNNHSINLLNLKFLKKSIFYESGSVDKS